MDFHAGEYDKFEQVRSAMNGTIIVTTSQLRASVIRCWQVGTSCARIVTPVSLVLTDPLVANRATVSFSEDR